jgi:eukaryotic-like serine/threonine-protein kinase
MEPALQSLTDRLNQLSDQFRELREGVQQTILIADLAPEMALTRARKVLEYVVREIFERRVKEPPGTRPLENLLDRLVKDGHFPVRLDAYAAGVRKFGNVGTHNFSERITAADVYQSLTQLMPILEWYFEEERPDAGVSLGLPQRQEETIRSKPVATVQSSKPETHLAVVPKGLRSFDANDAKSFLQLLPGPRDENGLPESIGFWKYRIESTHELTFTVGVIYGPSGCGKTSLAKAALLPRLADRILSVYVEATGEETEVRLLKALRKRCPGLPADLDLAATIIALRQGQGLQNSQKVLIVLDQFEQWLHANREDENSELVGALRQCDGERVQAILMVRDDFWVALSRFMTLLQIDLMEGQNVALIDLFELRHAKKVLTAFGVAFGALPENLSKDQESFLDQAVAGLAQGGRVVSVLLALFADMVKSKAWTLATLKEVGGMEGVGVTFLEETFSVASAKPKHRLHQKAAREVLGSLLPEQGTNIKGHMRSRQELLEASGYVDRAKEFEELIRILDNEVRLITPTDPEGIDSDASNTKIETSQRYYQLTHDYLVPSLRQWLTGKQRETLRGRAELRLADRAAVWNAKPENRLLPSLWEFLNIRLLADKKKWTPPQRKMMGKAGRLHGIRCGVTAAVVVTALFFAWEITGRFQAASLVDRLVSADITEVPAIVQKLRPFRRWANLLLRQEDANSARGSNQELYLAMALLPVDASKIAELRDRLPLVSPSQFPVVRTALLPYKDRVTKPLWNLALDPKRDVRQRFEAACALATYAPDDREWGQVNTFVAARLVTLEASALVAWREALRPAKDQLIKPLSSIYRDTSQKEQSRIYAAETLTDYAGDRLDGLFDLLADAELFQFPVLLASLAAHKDKTVALAHEELGKHLPDGASEDQKERLAKRQANAAIAMLELGAPGEVWPRLDRSPDPRVRSYIIHRLSPLGVDPQTILQRLDAERDVGIRQALVLALGEFTVAQLAAAGLPSMGSSSIERPKLIEKLLAVYEDESDAGLHGAVEWLLRKWGQSKRLDAVVEKLRNNERQMQARTSNEKRQWYVNTQNQTFVTVDAGEFVMGSPASESDRFPNEFRHRCRIGRRFAISSHEVTKAQYRTFQQAVKGFDLAGAPDLSAYVRTDDSPQTDVTWYEAAHYCNWLNEQEGIDKAQWCYEPNKQGAYLTGMKAKDQHLKLTGYRLPTDAEWEYACRAGTETSRYYGATETLLPNYAWYHVNGQNRTWPTGRLLPNDIGLFDMHGNADEWCFDQYIDYRKETDTNKVFDDAPTTRPVEDGPRRVLRGGAFYNLTNVIRSADRYSHHPADRNNRIGFRPARTCP